MKLSHSALYRVLNAAKDLIDNRNSFWEKHPEMLGTYEDELMEDHEYNQIWFNLIDAVEDCNPVKIPDRVTEKSTTTETRNG